MKNEARGLARIRAATGFSMQGLKAAYRHEEAFRTEVWLALAGIPLALWLGDTAAESVALIASLMLVLIVELLNSAVETVVDRVGEGFHELSGRAKDIGSAAVMLSLILAGLVWATLLWP